MLLHILAVHSSLLLVVFYWMNITQIVSHRPADGFLYCCHSLILLWIRLLWRLLSKSLCHVFCLLNKHQRVELLAHREDICLTLQEIISFFEMVVSLYTPTISVWAFQLFYILASICCLSHRWDGISLWLPLDYWHWAHFQVLISHSCIFFCQESIQAFCSFLLGCFLIIEL